MKNKKAIIKAQALQADGSFKPVYFEARFYKQTGVR